VFLGIRFWKNASPRLSARVDSFAPLEHPAGPAFEGRGPLGERAQDPVAHGQVVVDQVQLGLLPSGKVHLVRIGDLDDAVSDLDLHERGRHTRTLLQRAAPITRGGRAAE